MLNAVFIGGNKAVIITLKWGADESCSMIEHDDARNREWRSVVALISCMSDGLHTGVSYCVTNQ